VDNNMAMISIPAGIIMTNLVQVKDLRWRIVDWFTRL